MTASQKGHPCMKPCLLMYFASINVGFLAMGEPHVGPGQSPYPPYPLTSPPFTLPFSIFYFFFFLLASSIVLLFHPFPFYQNNPTLFPGQMS